MTDKKEQEVIEASEDKTEGFAHCVICGHELEMTIKFVKLMGISSLSCTACDGSTKQQQFLNRVNHFMQILKLPNKETKEKLRKEGFFIDVI